MRQPLRILFCGEGLALSAVIEHARRRGHELAGVFATADSEARVLRRSESCVSRPSDTLARFAARQPYEVLLSVNNGRLLDAATIRSARVAAINYHNGPLPAYAGLRATAWAVLNGESQHGISWHRIEPGIDTGNLLVQRHFALSAQETTASLNARCTAAAIESLDELFAALEGGDLEGRAQDLGARSYFRRSDTVPGAGLIDWRWPGERTIRLIRACDWGAVPNDFGTATVLLPCDGARYARQGWFEPSYAAQATPPGRVIGSAGRQLQVACADGVLTVELDRPALLAAGVQLPLLEPQALEAIAQRHRAALRAEPTWLPALEALVARQRVARPVPEVFCAEHDRRVEMMAAVERVLGGGALLAVQAEPPSDLAAGWRPVRARDELKPGVPAPLRDLALRHPFLAGRDDWWEYVDFRIVSNRHPGSWSPAQPLVVSAVHDAVDELESEARRPASAATDGLLARIFAWAAADPHAPALDEGGQCWTRQMLVGRANALAHALRAGALRRRGGVGVLLGPGAEFVIAALGAMLARAAYVPLNLDSPDRRRVIEVAEAGITHLITRRTVADTLPELDVTVLCIEEIEMGSSLLPLPAVCPQDAAYRIFTSGSTGRPKAVEVTHAALDSLCAHYRERLQLQPTDRTSFLAHPTFDASVADIWPILAAGGTLWIPPTGLLLDPLGLIDALCEARITHAFVPTAVGARLIQLPWPRDITLRHLLTGGEALQERPRQPLPFEFINTYGPTENTVDSLWAVIGPGEGAPPIGRPIAGVRTFVMDPAGNPLAPGEAGELLLGGAQLARGYFGRPEQTIERFATGRSHAGRWYRTGDLVRVNGDGEFEFLGRLDQQVQLRGIRVEPGEIEAVLHADPRVRDAVCVPRLEGREVTGLALHVTTTAPAALSTDEVRTLLRAYLTPALVPGTIEIHDELPRTVAGKIDRQALAASSKPAAASPDIDPLTAIWRSVLPAAEPHEPERTFWDLGGTSIGAMNLLLAVYERLGVHIPIATFLTAPTCSGLRRLVQARPRATVIEFQRGTGTPLICWYGLSGDLAEFQHVVQHDLGDRPVLGVISPATFAGGPLPASVEEAVSNGLAALQAHGMPQCPAMVGFSWGGLLAFEAARQLAQLNNPASFVGLIGTYPPIRVRGRAARYLHFLRALPAGVYRKLRHQDPSGSVRATLQRFARFVGRRGAQPPAMPWASPLFHAHAQLAYHYQPGPVIPLELLLVRDLDGKDRIDTYGYLRFDEPDLGWQAWAGRPVSVTWMPGDHGTVVTRAYATQLAELLRSKLAQISETARRAPSR